MSPLALALGCLAMALGISPFRSAADEPVTAHMAPIETALPIAVPSGPATLLDGRCEPAYAAGARVTLAHGLTLSILRHEKLLMLCVPLPPGSWGTLDLYLTTPRVATPLNLHASAKLGERTLAPSGWPAWKWWNEHGWASTVIPWMGCAANAPNPPNPPKKAEPGCRADFEPRGDREVHLDLDRFGSGTWRAMVELNGVRVGSGEVSIVHPGAARPDDPKTWSHWTIP